MSKQKKEDAVSSSRGDSQMELKQGKKRKRVEVSNGAAPKKGSGTSSKFEDSNAIMQVKLQSQSNTEAGDVKDNGTTSDTPAKASKSTSGSSTLRQKSKPSLAAGTKDRSQGRNDKKPITRPQQSVPPHLLRKRDELLPKRKALPIWPQADTIKAALKKNNVLVLTGETGSGKSTQVPQFLLNEKWCTKCIAITQPRRVAAISLARRVAEEMGSYMGSQSPMAKVGYSVRFDNATGPNTKIKFLTEGMLLQEMLRDPIMSQYSAVVVDEVHERSVNVDLILGFLKNLVSDIEASGKKRQHPLKVVIMSATADVESLVRFFDNTGAAAPTSSSEGDDVKMSDESTQAVTSRVSKCFVEGRQFPVKTVHLPSPTQDWVESALKLIFQIHYKEPLPGDILVFLTGQDTIEGLEKLVNDYAEGMDNEVPKVSSPFWEW
jgi:ATP-dependent RNA helicase DHR2